MSVNYLRGTEINEKLEMEKLIKVLLMFSCSKVTLVYPTLPTLLVLILLGSSRSKYQWKRFLFQNFWHLYHGIKWQKTFFFRYKQSHKKIFRPVVWERDVQRCSSRSFNKVDLILIILRLLCLHMQKLREEESKM